MADARISAAVRSIVHNRLNGCCEYCWSQVDFSPDSFSVEHIIPRIKGGTDDLENLALACQGCNNNKFTATESIDPISGLITPLYHPRRDTWAEHFVWSKDFLEIVGKTPTARATISRLRLNRLGVVNLRGALKAINHHPPKL
jgi:hypothetical protein